jgi:hypothetical protein
LANVGFIQIGASAVDLQSNTMRHRSDERSLPPYALNTTTGSRKTIAKQMDVDVDGVHGGATVAGCELASGFSRQDGQAEGGTDDSANWVPQERQIK